MAFLDLLAAARRSGDFAAVIDAIPYARFLDLTVRRGDAGPVTVLPFSDLIVGNDRLPAIHGGVTGALLESAAIITLMAEMEVARLPKTINITIDYLRIGRPADSFAAGTVTRHGRRVANVRAEAWQDDRSQPIALANAHFLVR